MIFQARFVHSRHNRAGNNTADLLRYCSRFRQVIFYIKILLISDAQAKQIKDKVEEMATSVSKEKVSAEFRKIWTWLKDQLNVSAYQLIAKEDFNEAMKLLSRYNASYYRGKLKKTDNDVYRKKMYGAIHARAKELNIDIHSFATGVLKLKKPLISLTELSDTRLKKLYDKVFSY